MDPLPSFSSSRVVQWATLSDAEREQWTRFIVDNGVSFFKDSDGAHAANIRLFDSSVIDPAGFVGFSVGKAASKKERGAGASASAAAAATLAAAGTSGNDSAVARMIASLGSGPGALFDYSIYRRFSSLIKATDDVRPKARALVWLARLMEDLYDLRYAKDMDALERVGGDDAGAAAGGGDASAPFPEFVFAFFEKRYGLSSIVQQQCWDLLYTVHTLRKDHLAVEVFARFLEEYYDADDLLFFLYARSTVQRTLGVNFRAHWNDLGGGHGAAAATQKGSSAAAPPPVSGGAAPAPLFVSLSQCSVIARVIFGSEADPLYRPFVALIERHMQQGAAAAAGAGAPSGRPGSARPTGAAARSSAPTMRLEVSQFLHLALVEYHETRPSGSSSSSGVGGGGGGGGDASGSDADKLLREALRTFDDRQRVGGDAPLPAYPPMPSAGGAAAAALRPSPELLSALGERMNRAMDRTLEELLNPAAAGLPGDMRSHIHAELSEQLEGKVDALLGAVIAAVAPSGDGSSTSGSTEVDALARRFGALVAAGADAGEGAIDTFCDLCVGAGEVRDAVGRVARMLIEYASTQLALQRAAAV